MRYQLRRIWIPAVRRSITATVCVGSAPPPPPAPTPTIPGDLVITEVMANPGASGTEWFEIFNPTATDFDLQGVVIKTTAIDHSIQPR